jgi:hypothetical protein
MTKRPRRILIPVVDPEYTHGVVIKDRYGPDIEYKHSGEPLQPTGFHYLKTLDFMGLLTLHGSMPQAGYELAHRDGAVRTAQIVIPNMFSLTKATATGRNPHDWYLKSKPDFGSQYYGRIEKDGSLHVTEEWLEKPELAKLLNEIEHNPLKWFDGQRGKNWVRLMTRNNSRYGTAKITNWESVVLSMGPQAQRTSTMKIKSVTDRRMWVDRTLDAWRYQMLELDGERQWTKLGIRAWVILDNETNTEIMRYPYENSRQLSTMRGATDEWSSLWLDDGMTLLSIKEIYESKR